MRRKDAGFSLVELMAVIVIIGALLATALPNYKLYVANSKLAESYLIMSTMAKSQLAWYAQYSRFRPLTAMPANLNEPMLVSSNTTWSAFGYPANVGSKVHFAYTAAAGHANGSGSWVTIDPSFPTYLFRDTTSQILAASYTGPLVTCNSTLGTAGSLGVPTSPGATADFVVITAIGDLNQDRGTQCTVLAIVMYAGPNANPGVQGGIIRLNVGK